jgi:hypothetical protein
VGDVPWRTSVAVLIPYAERDTRKKRSQLLEALFDNPAFLGDRVLAALGLSWLYGDSCGAAHPSFPPHQG